MLDPTARDLISRMADELDHYRRLLTDDRRETHALATEARAYLAAKPQGEGPTYDDLSDLCSQHGLDVDGWPLKQFDAFWEIVRAVLTRWGRPAAPPAEGEVAELVEWLALVSKQFRIANFEQEAVWTDRTAALLQQQHPQPVPVSERLPGPEDCDAEGRCWWWRTDDADEWWELLCIADAREHNARCGSARYTHWIPASALPLPASGKGQP